MTIDRDTYHRIAGLITGIVDTHALARFGNLAERDISEKNPGDLVTIADTATETALTETLLRLVPGSVAVGEEACETNPRLVDVLATDTPAWIIDPIDGTSNFACGNPDYSCLVALARGGSVEASWLYAPSLSLSAGAHDGQAWINDAEAYLAHRDRSGGLDLVTTHPGYTGGYHDILNRLDRPGVTRTPCSSAGLSYIDLIRGRHDALVYTWEKPWDHATGLHIHATLGGTHTTLDGKAFNLAGGNTLPFITGSREAVAAVVDLLT